MDQLVLEWMYNIWGSAVNRWPYPHCRLSHSIPDPLYQEIIANLPDDKEFVALHSLGRVKPGKYPNRLVLNNEKLPSRFWYDLFVQISSPEFAWALCGPFIDTVTKMYPEIVDGSKFAENGKFAVDMLLCNDKSGYFIGPHTDTAARICSALFYLTPFESSEAVKSWGTSIYLPKDRKFADVGGPHHKFEDFDRVCTIPWEPNSGLLFLKTINSWHGVEPIPAVEGHRRIVLIVNVRRINVSKDELRRVFIHEDGRTD